MPQCFGEVEIDERGRKCVRCGSGGKYHGRYILDTNHTWTEEGDIVHVTYELDDQFCMLRRNMTKERDESAENGWVVIEIAPSNNHIAYPWRVSGFNHYNGQTFSWCVPKHPKDDPKQYDLSLVEVRS